MQFLQKRIFCYKEKQSCFFVKKQLCWEQILFSRFGCVGIADGIHQLFPDVIQIGYQNGHMIKLLTGKETVTEEDSQYISLANHITKDAPPVFLAATAEDFLTNFGALPVAQKYASLGLGYELHIFQHGPHGYALGDETTADGSSQMLNASYAKWLDMSVDWLYRIFGQLEFVDKSTSRMGKYLAELGITMPGGPAPKHG